MCTWCAQEMVRMLTDSHGYAEHLPVTDFSCIILHDRGSEIAQGVKVLAAKPDSMHLIPRTPMANGEN